MNEAIDLSVFAMGMCGVLMLIPLAVAHYLQLGVTRSFLVSSFRMIVQLVLIGFFLEYLFRLNSAWVNAAWFMCMIGAAVLSVIGSSGLKIKQFAFPLFASLMLANFFVVIYFNIFIANLNMIFDARYMIAIGGMVLGNTLRSNIIGIGDFYKTIKTDEQYYLYRLSLGASRREALMPFVKQSFTSALNPTIATMATMGIVSLPGMMTGQILGGSVPLVAIKYQIAIMVAILASTVLSIALSIFFTVRFSFYPNGTLNKMIFKNKST